MRRSLLVLALVLFSGAAQFRAAGPVHYRLSFPEPEHRWMQVEVSFTELGGAPLELRMSRSSPGRYSLHEFAKNVYDVRAYRADGREIATRRTDPHGWTVAAHEGAATIKYKVFGDRVDGTYLAIDPTHAHINMPAALMWARGLDDRPATVVFVPPAGRRWQVATQLHPAGTPFEFTAPNLQYLMDSPAEFGPVSIRQFSIAGRTFRFALHHTGADGELDAFMVDVEKIVREHGEIFGEYPGYEPGHYTFIADYLPWASGDGMEHRNSTIVTSSGALGSDRVGLLDTVSHEFFHGWNVERIRPRSLEPFDFERVNMSDELWLGEGFTQYYAPLVLSRTRLIGLQEVAGTMNGFIASIAANPARLVHSAVDMSRLAVFTDGGQTTDRTNWPRTFISYYQFGGAIALALDLTLRERSAGRVTLDDYMRAMWRVHGKPGGSRPGYVDRPYTMADAEARLAEVSGDAAFARDFFARYVQGHDLADYPRLLLQAGLVPRPGRAGRAGRARLGDVQLDDRGGSARVASPPPSGSPAYAAGLDVDDEIRELDGVRIRSYADLTGVLSRHRPGDAIAIVWADRTGIARTGSVQLDEDPSLEFVPIEQAGGTLTPAQRAFRDRWLN